MRHTALFAPVALVWASVALGGEPSLPQLPGTPARGELVELRIDGVGKYGNPFHPATVRVDAEVVAPSGGRQSVPAFFTVPHAERRPPAQPRTVSHLRLFFGAVHWRAGTRIELLMDDLTLVDSRAGERVVLDDFEGPHAWQPQRARIAIERKRAHRGKAALRVWLTVDKSNRWPGAGRDVGEADWSRFDQLRVWVCPLAGLTQAVPSIEYYTSDRRKLQTPVRALEGLKPGEWKEFVWHLPPNTPPPEWKPSGKPNWRLRLRPQEAGEHRVRVRVKDATGVSFSSWQTFRVADAPTDGYVRVSPKDPRYLAFDSGRPCFAIGINLLGRELDSYRHYLAKLAAQRGNFIRIWLSPKTLGIETKDSGPARYDQGRAAQLDALFDLCAEKGIYVMACVSDFREVNAGRGNSLWQNSPYNAANGGPCTKPEDFFTDPKAKEQYRAKLRYLVARWGHSPSVLAWEFFNEVNITNGWRTAPASVRAWHLEMAAYLRRIDPQRHLVTSSFAGIEDDALWSQPLMEIVQRHQYLDGERSFMRLVADAHATLRHHGKPVLMGEFGRRRNRYADLDRRGVSLHNGLWAAVLSGGCGTAMTWWWRWLDTHDLWPQFRAVADFIEGIDWPAEGFQPSAEAVIAAEPDPRLGFGPLAFVPTKGGFKPGPFNKPVALRVRKDGTLDDPDRLPRFLHGLRNHKNLHNPVTFHVELGTAGRFALVVAGVSGYGGAALELSVDGKLVRKKELPDTSEDGGMLDQYNGPHAVALPAGTHTVTVRNTGKDWIRVSRYEFSSARPTPPIRVLSLRGRRTILVWIWNETHAWYQPVARTPLLTFGKVSATLGGLRPGRYRVRPFDPWAGVWAGGRELVVGADGKARLDVGELKADLALRIERQ